MRFHYAYVHPYGEEAIVITGRCDAPDCEQRFHLVREDAGPRPHAPDCKCSNCYIPRV